MSNQTNITKKEYRAWCREEYGNSWYNVSPEIKKARKNEAKAALSQTASLEPVTHLMPGFFDDNGFNANYFIDAGVFEANYLIDKEGRFGETRDWP